MVSTVRALLFALALALPAAAEEPPETPIAVPSPIPTGFLLAWKPMILSVRSDTGTGAKYGSDTFQPFRLLGRYTTTLLGERLLARAEIEGGQFQTDTQGNGANVFLGSDGYDATLRLLAGTATRIGPGFTITGSAGLITRYQRGRAIGGAPNIGVFGATSNMELEYRVAPLVSVGFFVEGGLLPWAYDEQKDLGVLSETSEFRTRLQVAVDVTQKMSIDIGWDFTWWHASFTESKILSNGGADQALLLEAREHALTLGLRWRPAP